VGLLNIFLSFLSFYFYLFFQGNLNFFFRFVFRARKLLKEEELNFENFDNFGWETLWSELETESKFELKGCFSFSSSLKKGNEMFELAVSKKIRSKRTVQSM